MTNQTIDTLMSHRSTRKFTDEPIPDDVVETIASAGFAASTSNNIQAATAIRVRDSGKRAAIAALAGGQQYVTTCAAFLVWCADLHRSAEACKLGGGIFEPGMTEHMVIATVDAALAAQNAAVAAESNGLGICYIGGIRNDPAQMTSILNLPAQVFPVFGMCIGVPAEEVPLKPRLPLSVTLKEETYDNADDEKHLRDYDAVMREYYTDRGAANRSWIADMSKLLGKESRPHMKAFLNSQNLGTR